MLKTIFLGYSIGRGYHEYSSMCLLRVGPLCVRGECEGGLSISASITSERSCGTADGS